MKNRPFLATAHYRARQGAIVWKGIRYLIIRPETIAGFQKAVEKEIGAKTGDLIFQGGMEGGSRSARRLISLGGLGARATLAAMGAMGGEIGWGRFRITRFNASAREFTVTVRNSPFAEAYGPSRRPVCHLIRGVLSGVGRVIFGTNRPVLERRCAARGDGYCEFRLY